MRIVRSNMNRAGRRLRPVRGPVRGRRQRPGVPRPATIRMPGKDIHTGVAVVGVGPGACGGSAKVQPFRPFADHRPAPGATGSGGAALSGAMGR